MYLAKRKIKMKKLRVRLLRKFFKYAKGEEIKLSEGLKELFYHCNWIWIYLPDDEGIKDVMMHVFSISEENFESMFRNEKGGLTLNMDY